MPKKNAKKQTDALAAAIVGSRGNLTVIAETMGLTRGYVASLIDKNDALAEQLVQEREGAIDKLEHVVYEAADFDPKMALLVLSKQGRHRGWGDTPPPVNTETWQTDGWSVHEKLTKALERIEQRTQVIARLEAQHDE